MARSGLQIGGELVAAGGYGRHRAMSSGPLTVQQGGRPRGRHRTTRQTKGP